MNYFSENKSAVLAALSTDERMGLSTAEAERRLKESGPNVLAAKPKKSILRRFFEQFKDVMILILIAAAAVSFAIACIEGDSSEFFEPVLILLIVVLNAALGVLQESRAERALEALKDLSAPHARVLRDGKERIVDSAGLVPGDIIRLEAGDYVPADARLLTSAQLKAEESALTGESVPAEKDAVANVPENAPLGDRANMIFSGCSLTYGTALAVVTDTGMQTEMGKIAGLLSGEAETQTPLQQKLAQLGKWLGVVALIACGVVFAVGLMNGIPVMEIFMTAVSLAVSAIPEGLPAIVTVVLSIGVQRMVKRNAIIRRLPAVETLGSASVICSDKTGTLTQNRMTLRKVYLSGGTTPLPVESEEARTLIRIAALCCDGTVDLLPNGEVQHIGDPTETAIVLAAHRHGDTAEQLAKSFRRVAELPFDSDRKRMSVVVETEGKFLVITKGAYDGLLHLCTSGGPEKAGVVNDAMSAEALRILAVAVRPLHALPAELTPETLEKDLTFMGLLGMIDPPRPEVWNAVALCRTAGIRPVMITGDHVVTASAIAKELGILQGGGRAITGAELDAMSEEELDRSVRDIAVYARVSPENKIRIVKAWQKRGEVVAMTGDGVNDAPALKAADIGCAMGVTGTDVAKGAADMTLTDDNFATIVDAVREGRGIYANIKKVVGFLLGTNIGEVITVFAAMLVWHVSPLLSMQLLWINLVTDSLPAIALGMEPVEDGVMRQRPKPKNEGIFAGGLGVRVVLQGVMFSVLSLAAFLIGWRAAGDVTGGRTLAFLTLAVSQIVQAYNMRSDRSLLKIGIFTNRNLNIAALISLAMVAAVLFTPLYRAFGFLMLQPGQYFAALLLALVPVAVMETAKALGLNGGGPSLDTKH